MHIYARNNKREKFSWNFCSFQKVLLLFNTNWKTNIVVFQQVWMSKIHSFHCMVHASFETNVNNWSIFRYFDDIFADFMRSNYCLTPTEIYSSLYFNKCECQKFTFFTAWFMLHSKRTSITGQFVDILMKFLQFFGNLIIVQHQPKNKIRWFSTSVNVKNSLFSLHGSCIIRSKRTLITGQFFDILMKFLQLWRGLIIV